MARLLKLLSLAAILQAGTVLAYAPPQPSNVPTSSISTISDLYSAVCSVTQWVLVFGIIIGALFIIWGGVKYITSGGNSSSQGDAKKTILTAIIGVIFLILAVAIIRIIASFFGAQNFTLDLSTATCSGAGAGIPAGGGPNPTAPPPPPPPPPNGGTPTPSGTPGILPTSPPAPTPTPSGGPPPPPPPPPGP